MRCKAPKPRGWRANGQSRTAVHSHSRIQPASASTYEAAASHVASRVKKRNGDVGIMMIECCDLSKSVASTQRRRYPIAERNSASLGIAWHRLACSATGLYARSSGDAVEQSCSVVAYSIHGAQQYLLRQYRGGGDSLFHPNCSKYPNIALRKTPKVKLL